MPCNIIVFFFLFDDIESTGQYFFFKNDEKVLFYTYIYILYSTRLLLYFFSRSKRAGIFSHVFPLSQRTLVRKSTKVFTTLGGNTSDGERW